VEVQSHLRTLPYKLNALFESTLNGKRAVALQEGLPGPERQCRVITKVSDVCAVTMLHATRSPNAEGVCPLLCSCLCPVSARHLAGPEAGERL
jgi:hypothetical protein